MSIITKSALCFAAPSKQNGKQIKQALENLADGSMSCEATPVTLFLWRELYNQQVAFYEDMMFISFGKTKKLYLLPFAQDMQRAMELLKQHTQALGEPLNLVAAQGNRLRRFLALYEDAFTCTPLRDDFEYIYQTKALTDLAGKKFHSKRNHISRFSRTHSWQYEPLCHGNLQEVLAMADLWREAMERDSGPSESVTAENKAIKLILPHMDALGLRGGLIRVQGQVVAFCFGSKINDRVFDLHVEKALPEYREAYTVINREFAANALSDFEYVNREDDMGLPGLRRAKLSYHPDILLEKYILQPKGEENFA